MKGSAQIVSIVILVIIILLGMGVYIFLRSSTHQTTNSATTTAEPTLAIQVKDFAPSLPMAQKTTILIELSDSSEVKYIVPTSQVETYIKSLPEGYHVISKSP